MKNFEKYEKLKKLNEQEESAEKQLKKEKQRLKILQNQRKDLERKARTHRLCQHGALLERYFPPDEFTDEMIRFLMDGTFNRQDEAVRDLNGTKVLQDPDRVLPPLEAVEGGAGTKDTGRGVG